MTTQQSTQKMSSQPNAVSPSKTFDTVELGTVQNGEAKPPIPLEEDIMQCARIGALEHIQKMIQDGKYDAKYKDEEGITPLHVG